MVYTIFTVKIEGVFYMAVKAINFKIDEAELADIHQVSSVFNMTQTDIIKNALRQYIAKLKKDPFYRLTVKVKDADQAETEEILDHIDRMSDDDLEIVSTERFTT